jgi:hypothetical protein
MSGPKYPIIGTMRYLLFILAFPLLVHAETKKQQCDRLKVVASELEKMIQTKNYVGEKGTATEKCGDLPLSTLPGADYRCSDLASIEMQMKSIDNEIAMIKGIELLKKETIAANEFLAKPENQDKEAAITASQALYQNLKIAATVESFLKAKSLKDERLMTVLAQAPAAEFADEAKFKALITSTCKKMGLKGSIALCDETDKLTWDELKEVDGLLLLAKDTKRKFDKEQIAELEAALAIKDGDKPYSFTQMLSEVSPLPAGEAFPKEVRETLASIKLNDQVQEKYKFLKNFAEKSAELGKTKQLTQSLELWTRHHDLFDSLKRREQWELKSKLSVVLNELKGSNPPPPAACAQTRALTNNGEECLNALAASLPRGSAQQKSAENILIELKRGQEQIGRLDKIITECTPPENSVMVPDKCFDNIDAGLKKLDQLDAKSKELAAHRAKILEKSEGLMTSRDLAIHTLMAKQCMTTDKIKIQCDQEIGSISREAVALSDAAGEIVMMWDKPADDKTDVAALCKTPKDGAKHMDEICKIAQSKDPEKASEAVANKDHYLAPTEAPGNRSSGQGWADLLGGLAQAAGTLLTPNQQPMNPYATMFPYTPMVGQPRDIKNQIMDPYMVTGFGSYSSTPGLRPYSSVNSNVGTSSAYSFGSSTFFNSPVGW